MKKFYEPIDLRSRADMTAFLTNHFRYPTMNSWNQATSYACNLKADRLGLSAGIVDKILDMLLTDEFQDAMQELRYRFGEDHGFLWQAAMNGRSGGYLVLYQGCKTPSKYKSYCRYCGQRNYTGVAETGDVCGRCVEHGRVDYASPPFEIGAYPGRGTNDCEDFEDWSLVQLRERVRLVQEFDRLADSMVSEALELARTCTVEEEEYLVPKTRKVLVPSA